VDGQVRASTATKTTSLGRYQVIQKLAEGGMADVLLARTRGIEGFERHGGVDESGDGLQR
jgi:hypothetical protein